jgi:hypothetical protein
MREIDISHVLARLIDERYELDATDFLAEVQAPNRIKAIETFLWSHLQSRFHGQHFALDPAFLKEHIDWAGAWRKLRQHHGMSCIQLPKDPLQTMVRFLFVAGPNPLCTEDINLNSDQADPHLGTQFTWTP